MGELRNINLVDAVGLFEILIVEWVGVVSSFFEIGSREGARIDDQCSAFY